MPVESPLLRVPLHVTEDRLLGGLALAATLRAGRVVVEQGLLAQANGGAVVVSMAERIESSVVSHLCAAIDRGKIALERDGVTAAVSCRLGVVALDEGLDDECVPPALRDRLAFYIDVHSLGRGEGAENSSQADVAARARETLPYVSVGADVLTALCSAASALGVGSVRATLLAAQAARAHAALHGRLRVEEDDVVAAARLVLGPRATRLPADAAPKNEESREPRREGNAPHPDDADLESAPEPEAAGAPTATPEDIVLEAAKSGIPAGLLDALLLGRQPLIAKRSDGHAGATGSSSHRGRPAGSRPGRLGGGERLNVVETLRAAAPWQPLRRRERAAASAPPPWRIDVRPEDFRIARFRQRSETSVIFSVDASGSSALQRLAEAKGAVEQILADCYVRRDHVSLVAFRGAAATLLLPPTRSLVRVRRCLADLAGGGTTPISAGIDAALALALDARKRGHTPVVVLMTDGRANVARDGGQGGSAATDAIASATALRVAGVRALFLDTAPRPRPEARALSLALGARYVPLPYVDAAGISRQVQALAAGVAP
jgi:magnesium chelatase subunit D